MRPLVLAFASTVALSGSAFAEAPGEVDADPAPMGPSMVRPTVETAAPCAMGQRWSLGFVLGQASLAPKHSPDAKSDFAIGGLALRYRATRHLELELALTGGKEQLPDGSAGDRQLDAGTLGLRYRFAPGAAWNWSVMGALGSTSIASAGATQQERDAVAQKTGQLGIGVERRFERFAVQAELRWITMEQDHRHAKGSTTTQPPPSGGYMPTPDPTGTTPPSNMPPTMQPPPMGSVDPGPGKLEGGQVTLGLSYYF